MPSADFCVAVSSPCGSLSPNFRTRHRPPRLSLTTFAARPPDLQHWPLMDGGLRCLWSARPNSTAYYPIPVRRAATLLHAAFRRHVTMTPLRFANPSPPSSWIRDFHPQVGKHAWQTKKGTHRPEPASAVSYVRFLKARSEFSISLNVSCGTSNPLRLDPGGSGWRVPELKILQQDHHPG